jgi:hypothetical protein
VRWDRPFADPQTHVRVELAREGTGSIISWDCRSGGVYRTSCYAGNLLSLHVCVSIATSDGRLAGSFIGTLEPELGTITRYDSDGSIWLSAVTDIGSVLGTLDLGALQPAQTVDAEIEIIRGSAAPRIQIRIVTVEHGATLSEFYALPVDGCRARWSFIAQGQPLTDLASPKYDCEPAHFAPGSCCYHVPDWVSPYPFTLGTDLSCSTRADLDAGDAG